MLPDDSSTVVARLGLRCRFFRPFGRAKDKGSRNAAPFRGPGKETRRPSVGIMDVPSADPLRQAPVRGCPPRFISGGPKTAGQNGFGDFCRNKSHPPHGAGAPLVNRQRRYNPSCGGGTPRNTRRRRRRNLPNPNPGITKYPQPRPIFAPLIGVPGVCDRPKHPLRMRHHDRETTVGRG